MARSQESLSPSRRKIVTVLLAALLVLAQGGWIACPAAAESPPNFVVIMVDDMDARMVDDLPRLRSLMSDQGATFTSFYAASPSCCPSRASFLRGQYPHNTGVLRNEPPDGGLRAFRNHGNESSTIATWLDDAGYRTGLVGKYLNGYEEESPKHVPPGWDQWFVYAGKGKYRTYRISENGRLKQFGKNKKAGQYQTDVLARRATQFIHETTAETPFFLFVAPSTPHEPSTPAKRHKKAPVARSEVLRTPSFNEADVSDKPGIWGSMRPLGAKAIKDIDGFYARQQRAMFAVEDMIADILQALESTGRADNTFLFFTSDNGYHHGEHRIRDGKGTPYEESIRVPLLVRGPGIPQQSTVSLLTSNIDMAPTMAALAGVTPPELADGRSFAEALLGDDPVVWRDAILIELNAKGSARKFRAMRVGTYAFFAFDLGARELYDLDRDPYQIENIANEVSLHVLENLENRLAGLASCGSSGPQSCQVADRIP